KSAHVDHAVDTESSPASLFGRIIRRFNLAFEAMLQRYKHLLDASLLRPVATVAGLMGVFLISLGIFPLLGLSFLQRTDAGQFTINLKAPAGTRLEETQKYVERVEETIRSVVPERDLGMVVSNIGVTPGFSSIYTSNSAQHTATVQVSLKEGHKT